MDFASSFLCGYLCIQNLTDDWPELTTYFDAEIIGSRYGFLTQNWGANEPEDMLHWSRFPAFRHVQNDLQKPYLTMPDRDRGAVFMRWKERFLVPDHRVQDINGASFAGENLPLQHLHTSYAPQPWHSLLITFFIKVSTTFAWTLTRRLHGQDLKKTASRMHSRRAHQSQRRLREVRVLGVTLVPDEPRGLLRLDLVQLPP